VLGDYIAYAQVVFLVFRELLVAQDIVDRKARFEGDGHADCQARLVPGVSRMLPGMKQNL
jgi:hypothetical protein